MSTDFQENNYTIEELNLPISISHVISKGEDCSDLHIHSDQYEIYVFLRGDIDYFAGNIRKHLVRGDALIVSPNELHRPYLIKETAYEACHYPCKPRCNKEIVYSCQQYIQIFRTV